MTICCNEPTCLAGGCRHNDLTVLGYFSFLVVINIIIIMIYISEFPNGEKLCCTDDFKGQRRKTLGSRVSLLPGKLLCVRKVIALPESYCAYNRKTWSSVSILWGTSGQIEICLDSLTNLQPVLILSKHFQLKLWVFQMISHFPDSFKIVWIFPDNWERQTRAFYACREKRYHALREEEDFWRGKIYKTLKACFLEYCVPQLAQKVAVGWPGLACHDNSAKRKQIFELIFVSWSICICIS